MIFLRTSGPDESVGASNFCSIPQPVGTRDGDLVVVGIAISAGVVVSPPNEDWVQVAVTDVAGRGIVAFYKYAMSEPARWVFTLSASDYAVGGALVYGNADGFQPIEAFAVATSAAAGPFNAPNITAADDSEELVYFFSATAAGTFTPLTGFSSVVARSPSSTFAAHRRGLTSAGLVASAPVTFSNGNKTGAMLAVVLRPSVGTLSFDDARERVVSQLPAGAEDVYDLTVTGDYRKYFQVFGSMLKMFAFDLVDLARRELSPRLARYKLPDWEHLFGLETTRTAKLGTLPQRRQQVVGGWRAAAGLGSTFAAVRATLGTLLGYAPATNLLLMECDRPSLTAEHSYALNTTVGGTGDVAIPGPGVVTLYALVTEDGGVVAKMGAQLTLALANPGSGQYQFTLTAPSGQSKSWLLNVGDVPLVLYAPELAGARVDGLWKLQIANGTFVANTLYSDSTLFVEGIQQGQQTAGAIFEWGVYADPAHLGENGTPADLVAARDAIDRLAFSHTRGSLLQSLEPYPDTDAGVNSAVPDECVPT